jgi:hypothetical protein
MAPEQAAGATVDERADVYALGAVLFELLTLEPLHERRPVDEMLQEIMSGVEARPSVRVPTKQVPPELEKICVTATRLEPSARLQSAKELHDAVEAYLDGDRDQELRRETAARRVAEAESVIATLDPDDEAARTRALRAIGQALAFDPDNKDALGSLVRLLVTPPKKVPAEVVAEREEDVKRHQRLGAIAATCVYTFIVLDSVSTYQSGVEDPFSFWTVMALWFSALLASVGAIVRPSNGSLFLIYVLAIIACIANSTHYSPHLLVPTLICCHVVLFSLMRSWKLRAGVIAVACVAYTLAILGERWGLFPRTVDFVGGNLVIHSNAMPFKENHFTVYLWLSMLEMFALPAVVLGFQISSMDKTDETVRMQAWQLKRVAGGGP